MFILNMYFALLNPFSKFTIKSTLPHPNSPTMPVAALKIELRRLLKGETLNIAKWRIILRHSAQLSIIQTLQVG